MGMEISEYDVQDESDVYDDLEDLPNFSMYVSKTVKKQIKYKFWSRTTIPWSINCDDTHPRYSVVAAANEEDDKSSLN